MWAHNVKVKEEGSPFLSRQLFTQGSGRMPVPLPMAPRKSATMVSMPGVGSRKGLVSGGFPFLFRPENKTKQSKYNNTYIYIYSKCPVVIDPL